MLPRAGLARMGNNASDEEAREAIRRYQTQRGFTDLDATNPEHIEGYRIRRQTMMRVPPEKLQSYLSSRESKMGHGSQDILDYWGVPKTNFPNGLPGDIRAALVTPESLSNAEMIGKGKVDTENYYVVDQVIPRERLKAGVRIFRFFAGATTTMVLNSQPQAANEPPAPHVEPPALTNTPASAAPQPQAGALPPVTDRPRQPPKREGSDPSDHEEPAAKRRRQLGELISDLRKSIEAASKKGKWYSASPWCNDSVAFFVQELMKVLSNVVAEGSVGTGGPAATGAAEPAAATGPSEGTTKLLSRAYRFLADTFMQFPVFRELQHFKDVFPSLEEKGAPATGSGKLVELLAGVIATDSSQLDLSSFDVVDRNHFRRTELFRSYCEHTFELWMDAASMKLAATGACEVELQTALEIQPVGQGLIDTANHALRIFNPEAAENKHATMEYVLDNKDKGIIAFLRKFAPGQSITLASQMMLEETTFNTWSMDHYIKGARYSGISK